MPDGECLFGSIRPREEEEVNLILQPWMIPSSIAPPRMPGFTFLRPAPRPVWKVFWRALDVVGDVLVGRDLNRLLRTPTTRLSLSADDNNQTFAKRGPQPVLRKGEGDDAAAGGAA